MKDLKEFNSKRQYLLIIDMQEEYTGENRNRKKFPYNMEELIEKINKKIAWYPQERVVYIKNQFFWESKDTEKYFTEKMQVVSDHIFTKRRANAFTNMQLVEFLKNNTATDLEVVGIDGNYCVKSTAIAAAQMGYNVMVDETCTGIADLKKYKKAREKMKKLGIQFPS